MSDLAEFIESTYRDIPILKAMGMQVAGYDGSRLELAFPLAQNINDKGTGFAGSLNAAATYCAWSLVHLLMREEGFNHNLAVVSSQVEYQRPVIDDFTVCAALPDADQVAVFLQKLKDKGKASITLEAHIYQGEEQALYYRGIYVAFPK